MKSLITGMGFVGHHLAEYLINKQDHRVMGIGVVDPLMIPKGDFEFKMCDVTEMAQIDNVIKEFSPDNIFHLAAQSSVAKSWQEPRETIDINLYGVYNVLQSVRETGKPTRIHIACSSDEYGKVKPENMPLTEEHPLMPGSPYALSKVFQDYVGIFFAECAGLSVFRTRAFNHTGPGQAPTFVCSDFARQIAQIEKGICEPVIKVGNLQARRDFTDVRDVVAAYWAVLDRGQPGEIYNICSGVSIEIAEVLDRLLKMATVEIKVIKDPQRDRPSDIPELRGDYSKVNRVTGWKPEIDFNQTLGDILEYWRKTISSSRRSQTCKSLSPE